MLKLSNSLQVDGKPLTDSPRLSNRSRALAVAQINYAAGQEFGDGWSRDLEVARVTKTISNSGAVLSFEYFPDQGEHKDSATIGPSGDIIKHTFNDRYVGDTALKVLDGLITAAAKK